MLLRSEALTAPFQMRQYKRGTHNASKIVKKLLFIFMGFCFSHHFSNKKLWRFCIEIINPRRESEPVEVIASNYIFFYFDFFCVLLECFLPFSTIFLWEMGQKPLRKIRLLVFLELYNQPDNSIFFLIFLSFLFFTIFLFSWKYRAFLWDV